MMIPVSKSNVLPMILAALLVPVSYKLGQHIGNSLVDKLKEREVDDDDDEYTDGDDDDGEVEITVSRGNFKEFCQEVVAPSICDEHLKELIEIFQKEAEERASKSKEEKTENPLSI